MVSDSAAASAASSRAKRVATRLSLAAAALVVWGITWASIVLPQHDGRPAGASHGAPRADASFEPDLPPAAALVTPSADPTHEPTPSPSASAKPSSTPRPSPATPTPGASPAVAPRTPTPTPNVTIAINVGASGPWFYEEDIRVTQPGTLTALTLTITVRRTGDVSYSGQWDTVGSPISQSHSSSASTITYTFRLGAGQTLSGGTTRTFAALFNGSGGAHPTSGDTYSVTVTVGGVSGTRSGHF
jgi:endoglucanase